MFPEHLQQPVIGWALRAPVLFYRDRRIAVGGRLSDLITLARFFPKDAIVNALRFFVGHAARFHVALQGGTATSPLGLDGPLVFYVLQLQVVHLVGTALPENTVGRSVCIVRSFDLGVFASCAAALCCTKNKCPSWRGKAPVRPRCQGRGVGVHRSEAQSLL